MEENNYRNFSSPTDQLQSLLLEQYRIYVNSAELISDRRSRANSFFLTINSAIFLIVPSVQPADTLILISSCVGIVICYQWYRLIVSYKTLNTAKFEVIHLLEKELPYSVYDHEWKILEEGKNRLIHIPFTDTEIQIPWTFMAMHFLMMSFLLIEDANRLF